MPVIAQLTISVDDAGSVSVTGPIDQLMLCYGLLEMARDSLSRNAEETRKKVQAPTVGDVAAFTRRP